MTRSPLTLKRAAVRIAWDEARKARERLKAAGREFSLAREAQRRAESTLHAMIADAAAKGAL